MSRAIASDEPGNGIGFLSSANPIRLIRTENGCGRDSYGLAHFCRFSLVGAIGIAVQVGALALFHRVAALNYLVAVAIAVELAIAHNFFWHRRWTWADRPAVRFSSILGTLAMFLRFNFTTGAVSLAGNLVFMRILVGQAHIGVLRANLISITLCWVLNFLLSDRIVFV